MLPRSSSSHHHHHHHQLLLLLLLALVALSLTTTMAFQLPLSGRHTHTQTHTHTKHQSLRPFMGALGNNDKTNNKKTTKPLLSPLHSMAAGNNDEPSPSPSPAAASRTNNNPPHQPTSTGAASPTLNPPKAVPAFVAEGNKVLVQSIKDTLFNIYGDRHYARFHALETIARVPYFAYTSVLHLYETLGWRRRADLMKIHFAESWNELHHLLIMEELGGNKEWGDRLISVHLAFFYYWLAIVLYITNPEIAYNLNEQVERHAFDTYDKFLNTNEAELKALPAPAVAKEYYQTGDLYMFDEFHTSSPQERRRPRIQTLYDVFVNIRNDEREHYMTMEAMQKEGVDGRGSMTAGGRGLEALEEGYHNQVISPNTLNPLNNPNRGRDLEDEWEDARSHKQQGVEEFVDEI